MVPPVEMSVIWRIGIRLYLLRTDGLCADRLGLFVWEFGGLGGWRLSNACCECKGSV